jgi:hypothetical protein
MWFLRQSTASQEVMIGPFVDDTDFKTAETALTINNSDVKLFKTGATSEVNKNSGGGTHVAGGRYYIVLDATDTNTIGSMQISVTVAGALPVWAYACVLGAETYDALFGTGTAALPSRASLGVKHSATVSAVTSTSVFDLPLGSSTDDDAYNGCFIDPISGTGSDQGGRIIVDYVGGTTRRITVDPAFDHAISTDTIVNIHSAPPEVSTTYQTGVKLADTTHGGGSTTITANVTGNLSGSVGSVTGAVGSVTTPVTLHADYNFAKGTTAMTESYNSDGSAPTPVQALYAILQFLTEKSISDTTMTVKKLDGATSAFTLTLNDATAATAITRAT